MVCNVKEVVVRHRILVVNERNCLSTAPTLLVIQHIVHEDIVVAEDDFALADALFQLLHVLCNCLAAGKLT